MHLHVFFVNSKYCWYLVVRYVNDFAYSQLNRTTFFRILYDFKCYKIPFLLINVIIKWGLYIPVLSILYLSTVLQRHLKVVKDLHNFVLNFLEWVDNLSTDDKLIVHGVPCNYLCLLVIYDNFILLKRVVRVLFFKVLALLIIIKIM